MAERIIGYQQDGWDLLTLNLLRLCDVYMRQEINQAIILTNAWILLIRISGTNFSEILSETHTHSFYKMHLKLSSKNGDHFVSVSLSLLIDSWEMRLLSKMGD